MKREPIRFGAPQNDASSVTDSTTELARRWRSGDISAFEKLVQRYNGPLLSYVISKIHHLQDGEDIVQEALFRAHRSKHQLKDDTKLWLWLKQITHNAMIDAIKRARRWGILTDPQEMEELMNQQQGFGSGFTLPEIVEQIERLPETYRETAIYYYLEEWPYSRIAEAQGVDPVTIRQRITRASRLLRESLRRKS